MDDATCVAVVAKSAERSTIGRTSSFRTTDRAYIPGIWCVAMHVRCRARLTASTFGLCAATLLSAQEVMHAGTVSGPIRLADGGATLELSPADRFVVGEEARRVLEQTWGNHPDQYVIGLVLPEPVPGEPPWAAVVSWFALGRLDPATESWNAEELLARTRREVAASVEPASRPEVLGWFEPPSWLRERATIQWGSRLRFPGDDLDTLNCHHVQLLRKGWVELTLLCPVPAQELLRAKMQQLAARLVPLPGAAWSDFVAMKDRRAAGSAADLISGARHALPGSLDGAQPRPEPGRDVAPQQPESPGLALPSLGVCGAVVLLLLLRRRR